LSSAARALLAAIAVAFGFLLIASNAGGQTAGDDHGNSFDTATLVELGTSVEARIDPGDDRDVFKFDLSDASGPTDLWVYTRGEFDTFGGLYDSAGTLMALNDDGLFDDQIRAFSIRNVVDPGVYYVIAVSYLGESGDYTLHARAVTDPGSSIKTAKPLVLGSHDAGTVDTGDGVDYFRLDFTEKKHVIIDARSANILALDAALLDSDGKEITANISPMRLRGFGALFPLGIEIAEDFEPGTYYLKVTSPGAPSLFGPPPDEVPVKPVPYAIFFEEDVEYTELLANCAADTAALNDPAISDPLYSCQWHLNSPQWHDINVQPVWEEGIKGEGIGVAVVDDGIYHAHEDLKDNIAASLNFDYATEGTDIYGPLDHHGTNVAGMIAARDNEVGVRGVAPRATVYGYNLLSGFNTTGQNIVDAMTRNMGVTAVSNNSWGPADGPGPSPGFALMRQAINAGITEGYDGKGVFYVFAAGNGHLLGDDSNLDGLANNHAVTAACSVHSEGKRAGYSEMGANLWVCAPSNDRPESLGGARGILTTENSDRYYSDFGGTSAAASLISGVAALTRSANSDLTWRDIKVILAASASKNDPASSGWQDGAAMHPVSSTDSYHFNHECGFGLVNAEGAVALAKRWTNLPEMQVHSVATDEELYVEIPDAAAYGSATTTTHTLTVETDIGFTEFVEVTIAFEHDSFRDLEILLESPSGAVSNLSVPFDTYDGLNNFFGEGFIPLHSPFQFGSAKHLGEDPNGEWKLHVTDRIPAAGGAYAGFSTSIYGHARAPGVASLDSVDVHLGGERLDVAWTAPDESGDSAITAYDVRYIPTEADETDLAGWTVLEGVWEAEAGGELEYSVTGLTDGTQYDVQVRAVNSSGGGLWSDTGTGTPMSSQCVTGGAVTDRSNGGVIHDCEALLDARDTLAGIDSTRTLNWTTDTPIDDWYGVVLSGAPERVVQLRLHGGDANEDTGVTEEKLNGSIPAALGRLSELTVLYLHRNNLTGEVPGALNSLSNLEQLYLYNNELTGISDQLGAGMASLKQLFAHRNELSGGIPTGLAAMPSLDWVTPYDNELTGTIPSELGGLTSLRRLYLHENELSGSIPGELGGLPSLTHLLLQGNNLNGPIPAELGGISSLVWLSLYGNVLTGAIPSELGGLANLQQLHLHENRLTGTIPSELGNLASLERWRLRGNRLTGCVPAGLAAVTDNDQASLGLPTCTDN
jgi:kexin